MSDLLTKQIGNWQFRHDDAVTNALRQEPRFLPLRNGFAPAIVQMLWAWKTYAQSHTKAYEEKIGEDYVLGPEWKNIGLGIRGLLNGVTGALDCGTLDAFILDTLQENGIETDSL